MTLQGPPTGPSYRTLIIENDSLVVFGLKGYLTQLGHIVVAQPATASEAETVFREEKIDLVFIDIRLDDCDGIELAGRLLKVRRCPIIVVSAYSEKELIDREAAVGVFGYIIKPVRLPALEAQIAIAINRFREQQQLQAEKDSLTQTLETRKLVEKAKGILMKRQNLSEADAHKKLQQESQTRRLSLSEIAQKIIEVESIMGGT